MSKILAKLVKKWAFLSGLIVGLVIAATIVGIFLGFNGMTNVSGGKKVTVTIDPVLYKNESVLNEIEDICDDAFGGATHVIKGDNGGEDGQFIYAFNANENVDAAVEKASNAFAKWTEDYSITVVVSKESEVATIAEGYVVRAAIAGVVLSVLALVYAVIRFKKIGLLAGVAPLAAMLLTGAIIIVTRIPSTVSVAYAIMLSGLVAAIFAIFYLNKLNSAAKSEGAAKSAEEIVVASIPVKEGLIFAAILGVAALAVCIPAWGSAAWLALSAFVGILVATFIGLVFTPAISLPVQQAIVAKAAAETKHGYKGAKKGEKKTEKTQPQKQEAKEEPAPVEEAAEVEEAPVEEAAAEEAPIDEAVEDVPAEEAELSKEDIASIDEAFADEE